MREHGRGQLMGGRELVFIGADRTTSMRSTKSSPLKFEASLCTSCNDTRSQPHDQAYTDLVSWIFQHEQRVLTARSIDLAEALGPDWPSRSLDVLRYWVKHICCRVCATDPDGFDARVPPDAIDFLDGGPPPEDFSFELWVEPTWLRFCEHGADDPLWVRPMLFDDLYWPQEAGGVGTTQSVWRYGWLSMGWVFGDGVGSVIPFDAEQPPLPFRAQLSADFEFTFSGLGRGGDPASDQKADARLQEITGGGPVDPELTLNRSPIADAFLGAALDAEAAARGRGPDRRDPLQPPDEGFDLDCELFRAALLGGIAREVWGVGHLDPARVHAVSVPDALDGRQLKRRARRLHRSGPRVGNQEPQASASAASSLLSLREAARHGVDPIESGAALDGQDALLDAAIHAGRAAAAAALEANDTGALWPSMAAACARMARLA